MDRLWYGAEHWATYPSGGGIHAADEQGKTAETNQLVRNKQKQI